eukprot:2563548-Alexandrium_andersonii.AAC.1
MTPARTTARPKRLFTESRPLNPGPFLVHRPLDFPRPLRGGTSLRLPPPREADGSFAHARRPQLGSPSRLVLRSLPRSRARRLPPS